MCRTHSPSPPLCFYLLYTYSCILYTIANIENMCVVRECVLWLLNKYIHKPPTLNLLLLPILCSKHCRSPSFRLIPKVYAI